MDFARVLVLVQDFFDEVDQPFAVIGALGLAAMKIFAIKNNPQRVLQDLEDIQRILQFRGVDREEIFGYFRRYGLEALLDRLD